MLLNLSWKVPESIGFAITTRQGGVSQYPFDSLNLGMHVGDDPVAVERNRQQVQQVCKMPSAPLWLEQVHGTQIIDANNFPMNTPKADGCYSNQRGLVCTVMTADCLPLLLCNKDGSEVAAVHAGWRGLCAGVIEAAISKFHCQTDDILALTGPCIGAEKFEVGQDVYRDFLQKSSQAQLAFKTNANNKYLADLALLAQQRLHSVGVKYITHSHLCTYSNPELFFSYRRNSDTGRMASFIWIK